MDRIIEAAVAKDSCVVPSDLWESTVKSLTEEHGENWRGYQVADFCSRVYKEIYRRSGGDIQAVLHKVMNEYMTTPDNSFMRFQRHYPDKKGQQTIVGFSLPALMDKLRYPQVRFVILPIF